MCDDHGAVLLAEREPPPPDVPDIGRRRFFGAGAIAAGAVFLGHGGNNIKSAPTRELPQHVPAGLAKRARLADATREATGESAYSMAMHVHSSFSEQSGSMDSQLFQAASNLVDVLWWTDHDHRMDGLGYPDAVHFTSLDSEPGDPSGKPWIWTPKQSGPLTSGGGGIVASPYSPNDPVPGSSLNLSASSAGPVARFGYYANSEKAAWDYRGTLAGQTLTIDVMPDTGWTHGYLELAITSSFHEASAGRAAGTYSLSYRFSTTGKPRSMTSGNTGIVWIPVPVGQWSTVPVTPSEDIAALWPDLDSRDFALWELTLSAVSTGDPVNGWLDWLRFDRTQSGQVAYGNQTDMMAVVAAKYPTVTQQQGLEVSWLLPHLNWFGPDVVVPDYAGVKPNAKAYGAYLTGAVIPGIHGGGGLVSYNHPFGYADIAEQPQPAQDLLLQQVAANLLPANGQPAALGCDLIEVGYNLRQGVDLAHHVALWDIMSRNAIFLTGNGTTDDHFGVNWPGIRNNWTTSAWAASTGMPDLLAALAAGRAWCGSLSEFGGPLCWLDLLVDGSAPMGSATVSTALTRSLCVIAAGIPAGGSVQVLQGAVDYAGTSGLASNAAVIASYPDTAFAGGSVSIPVDTSSDSYVRTQVLGPDGQTVVALSNPVWLFQDTPPGGIPAARAA
jgi:hypothetical protein